ncbi:GFA family protein [Acinetobacter stercoris]|uniref:Glutathione-dependent formaldehyde-activating enzyme n=1 Tax=Acinetobacter stercoris TaxID=2126983 RepID=A0A2U3N3M6_9GAMM|nr:GFA family protein [Acinetobacter stercoris]SPL72262.1 Glutathione-dependent formaldehyde-activating enzyme [Acinetobacter stercoris]
MLKGQCLCGTVQFKINLNDINTIYQCHCSLCRKQTGTHANFATLVNKEVFEWISGEDVIGTYQKETGFTSYFCQKCGSVLPNELSNGLAFWIPLGLNDLHPTKKLDFHLSSKANWEDIAIEQQSFSHLPEWDKLKRFFKL